LLGKKTRGKKPFHKLKAITCSIFSEYLNILQQKPLDKKVTLKIKQHKRK
jgi:hypothetical protein